MYPLQVHHKGCEDRKTVNPVNTDSRPGSSYQLELARDFPLEDFSAHCLRILRILDESEGGSRDQERRTYRVGD